MNQINANNDVRIDNFLQEDSNIVLHQGDTLQFLSDFPRESVKLIITSPPYNVGKEYETKTSIENYLETQKRSDKTTC